jgi:hypothetical protein
VLASLVCIKGTTNKFEFIYLTVSRKVGSLFNNAFSVTRLYSVDRDDK